MNDDISSCVTTTTTTTTTTTSDNGEGFKCEILRVNHSGNIDRLPTF